MPRPWPGEKVDHLRHLVKEGLTAGEIAKAFRVTRSTIIGKLDRIGVALGGASIQRQVKTIPRRYRDPAEERSRLSAAQRPVWGIPSPPRRFSWQEPVDSPEEHA